MDIDKEKFKATIREFFQQMKKAEREILATHGVLFALAQTADIPPEDIRQQLDKLREAVKPRVDQKYDQKLAEFLLLVEKAEFHQAVEQFLRSWKPSGPPS